MRFRPRLDANHGDIVKALRGAGCRVLSLAQLGGGVPDLLVLSPSRTLHLVEVKDGAKPASKQALTDDEQRFSVLWGCVAVVNSEASALAAVGIARNDDVER